MRVEIPQIKWHAIAFNEPINSLDFHPRQPERVATAGTDKAIKIWELSTEKVRGTGASTEKKIPIQQRLDGNLVRFVSHVTSTSVQNAVNVVRWHPETGHLLASGHSNGIIIIWKKQSDSTTVDTSKEELSDDEEDISVFNRENWRELKQLRNNAIQSDMQDLQWSSVDPTLMTYFDDPSDDAKNKKRVTNMCRYIVSGSLDSKVVVWDLETGTALHVLEDHRMHVVQGIALDPLGSFFASQCADRTVLIYNLKRDASNTKRKMKPIAGIKYIKDDSSKSSSDETDAQQQQDMEDEDEQADEMQDEDQDEEMADAASAAVAAPGAGGRRKRRKINHKYYFRKQEHEFFRRLSFSPDGSFLVTVAGQVQERTGLDGATNTAYVFARNNWQQPLCHLPGHKHMVVGVSFCPLLFKLRQDDNKSKLNPQRNLLPLQRPLDYRMIFAVISTKSIVIYDTNSIYPIAFLDGLHFAQLNEVKWSCDGQTLMVVSDDGYCSLVLIDAEELGEPIKDPEEMPKHMQEIIKNKQKAISQVLLLEQRDEQEAEARAAALKSGVVHTLVARKKQQTQQQQPSSTESEAPQASIPATEKPSASATTSSSQYVSTTTAELKKQETNKQLIAKTMELVDDEE